jgi:predicted ABC-type ATPase
MDEKPLLVLIGGPNGAGKSTLAMKLLPTLGVSHFVNADNIARAMAEDVESVAIQAGRAMLSQMRTLAEERENFAFESTLASRTFAKFIADRRTEGYRFLLYCLGSNPGSVFTSRCATRSGRWTQRPA